MNMTNNPFLVSKSLKETLFPETTSGKLKSGARVANSSIVDGVNDMGTSSVACSRNFFTSPAVYWNVFIINPLAHGGKGLNLIYTTGGDFNGTSKALWMLTLTQ